MAPGSFTKKINIGGSDNKDDSSRNKIDNIREVTSVINDDDLSSGQNVLCKDIQIDLDNSGSRRPNPSTDYVYRSGSTTLCRSERVSHKEGPMRTSSVTRVLNHHGDMGTSHYFEGILNQRCGVKQQSMFKSQIAGDAGVAGFGSAHKMFI